MVSLLSTRRPMAFVHIPKCAGTTVTKALLRLGESGGQKDFVASDKVDALRAVVAKTPLPPTHDKVYDGHARARDFRDALGAEAWAGIHSFAITRNPWERLLSTYHFIRRDGQSTISSMMRAMTFPDFIEWHSNNARAPQSDWLCDTDGTMLVTEVVPAERLNDFLEALVQRLYGVTESFGRENESSATGMSLQQAYAEVPDSTLEIFIAAYRADFDLLGIAPVPPGGARPKTAVEDWGDYSIPLSGLPFTDSQLETLAAVLGPGALREIMERVTRSSRHRATLESNRLRTELARVHERVVAQRTRIAALERQQGAQG